MSEESQLTFPKNLKKIKWLKENIDPVERVKQFWKDASKKRILQLIENTSDTEYFNTYPDLRNISHGP